MPMQNNGCFLFIHLKEEELWGKKREIRQVTREGEVGEEVTSLALFWKLKKIVLIWEKNALCPSKDCTSHLECNFKSVLQKKNFPVGPFCRKGEMFMELSLF